MLDNWSRNTLEFSELGAKSSPSRCVHSAGIEEEEEESEEDHQALGLLMMEAAVSETLDKQQSRKLNFPAADIAKRRARVTSKLPLLAQTLLCEGWFWMEKSAPAGLFL